MNYKNIQIIMEGAELLYSMLCELNDGIGNLPGCKVTAGLKCLSANISASGAGIYQTMKNIASGEIPCDGYEEDDEEYTDECKDIPDNADLKEFLDTIAEILGSGNPVSVSADIYITEGSDTENEECEE